MAAVTTAQLDEFRRRSQQCRHLGKVRVERHERKAVGLAYSHTTRSPALANSTSRTWLESGNKSANDRQSLKPILWSNAASFRGGHDTPFSVGRVGKARADVFFRELGIVGDDLLMRHAGGKPSEHVGDGNAHPRMVKISIGGFCPPDGNIEPTIGEIASPWAPSRSRII
jgi:hypothetical protein